MQHLINSEGLYVASDEWALYEAGQPSAPHTIYPLSLWAEQNHELQGGVSVEDNDNVDSLAPLLDQVEFVLFNFKKFADGRAFSLAKLLREQYQFNGDIRATGDILPDQANYLFRVGFSSLAFPNQERAETAAAVMGRLEAQYQSSTRQPLPRFRRR